MFDPNRGAPPFNPLLPVVWALAAAMALPELVFQLGESGLLGNLGIGWRVEAYQRVGWFTPMWEDALINGDPRNLPRLLTYPLVHLGFTSALFSAVFALAFGKFVSERMGQIATLLVFLLAAPVGGIAFALADGNSYLVGGGPASYGLMGAFTWVLWVGYGRSGGNQLAAFRLIAFLMGIQFLFNVYFWATGVEVPPWWVGDLAGFATGFLVAPLVTPGGVRALLNALRNR